MPPTDRTITKKRKRVEFGGVTIISIPARGHEQSIGTYTFDEDTPPWAVPIEPRTPLDELGLLGGHAAPSQASPHTLLGGSPQDMGDDDCAPFSASPDPQCSPAVPTTQRPRSATLLIEQSSRSSSSCSHNGSASESATLDDATEIALMVAASKNIFLGSDALQQAPSPADINGGVATARVANVMNGSAASFGAMNEGAHSPTESQLRIALDDVIGATPLSQCCQGAVTTARVGYDDLTSSEPSAARKRHRHPLQEALLGAENHDIHNSNEEEEEEEEEGGGDLAETNHCVKARRLDQHGSFLPVTRKLDLSSSGSSSSEPLVCAFCKHLAPAGDANALDAEGVHCHFACALWCPEVYFEAVEGEAGGGSLRCVKAALERSANIKCAVCRKGGAAVGCVNRYCQLSYHVVCAATTNAQIDREAFLIRCPRHAVASKDVHNGATIGGVSETIT